MNQIGWKPVPLKLRALDTSTSHHTDRRHVRRQALRCFCTCCCRGGTVAAAVAGGGGVGDLAFAGGAPLGPATDAAGIDGAGVAGLAIAGDAPL